MVSGIAFTVLVALVALQRLAEIRLSRQNERWLATQGAREHAPWQMKWMKGLHGAWLVSMPVEVFLADRPFVWAIAAPALLVFLVGQGLRYAAINTLNGYWTVRILTVPGSKAVTGGIYRYVRHPNYVGVVLELAALPIVHGAWATALVATALNGILLWRRIRAEEAALRDDTDYAKVFRRVGSARLPPKTADRSQVRR